MPARTRRRRRSATAPRRRIPRPPRARGSTIRTGPTLILFAATRTSDARSRPTAASSTRAGAASKTRRPRSTCGRAGLDQTNASSRGVTRLHGIFTSQPRRRRDPSAEISARRKYSDASTHRKARRRQRRDRQGDARAAAGSFPTETSPAGSPTKDASSRIVGSRRRNSSSASAAGHPSSRRSRPARTKRSTESTPASDNRSSGPQAPPATAATAAAADASERARSGGAPAPTNGSAGSMRPREAATLQHVDPIRPGRDGSNQLDSDVAVNGRPASVARTDLPPSRRRRIDHVGGPWRQG